jgi:hypothetical protein
VAIGFTPLFAYERHENIKLCESVDFFVVEEHGG